MPDVLRRIYAARGVRSAAQLEYALKNLLPPRLKGLDCAAELLSEAVHRSRRILIVGDFDADGATSTALAVRCLRAMGHSQVDYLVPNRFEFGYGLTPEIVEVAAQRRPDLIVTVDNGIASIDGVVRARELGIQVLVTDHHLPGEKLPEAAAIVNPNQLGCEFGSKAAAGVTVIFYVMMALRSALRARGWFTARVEPGLAEFLDLVALGTVADVVPLDYNNRILVSQGVARMRAGHVCPGILALLEVAGRSHKTLAAQDLGFVVGPRLNAAGRLDDMSLGIRCLLADTQAEALALAQELDTLNRERRAIELSMQNDARAVLDRIQADLSGQFPSGVCLYQSDWHQGVIGILASRIKDRLHRPVIVFANDDLGGLKGSGRSVAGVHLRDVLDTVATRNPHLLQKFGGHAMAAGLSLRADHLDEFREAFAAAVTSQLGDTSLEPSIESDGELDHGQLELALAEQLQIAGPWGQGFPEPAFDGDFQLISHKWLGGKHLKMVLAPVSNGECVVDAIAFNQDQHLWPDPAPKRVRVVYKLSVNEFRGNRSAQMLVDYLEPLAH